MIVQPITRLALKVELVHGGEQSMERLSTELLGAQADGQQAACDEAWVPLGQKFAVPSSTAGVAEGAGAEEAGAEEACVEEEDTSAATADAEAEHCIGGGEGEGEGLSSEPVAPVESPTPCGSGAALTT